MFELMRVHEAAKNEKNKFLRYFLLKYSNYRLKKSFFNKFDIKSPDFEINKDFFTEFFQFYNCTSNDVMCKTLYPRILNIDVHRNLIVVNYKYFRIYATIKDDECIIGISKYMIDVAKTTISIDYKIFKHNILGTIILMAIYNYCVSYIYGLNSDLYMDDEFTKILCDMYF